MGRFQHGHVKEEDGKILVYGSLALQNGTLEFKNYFEFTDSGTILDGWFSLQNGEWRRLKVSDGGSFSWLAWAPEMRPYLGSEGSLWGGRVSPDGSATAHPRMRRLSNALR